MPRKFAEARPINRPAVSHGQHLDRIILEAGLDQSTGNVDPNLVGVYYEVNELRDDNTFESAKAHIVKLADMPAGLKRAFKKLREECLAYAEAEGHLEAGTDEGEVE